MQNKNPYFNLIHTVWQNGQPWRRIIVGYYCAYILAQGCLSLSPYAFGKTVEVLQHFSPARFHEVVFWLSFSVVVFLIFWLFHGPARVKERAVAQHIQQALRVSVYEKLIQLPLKWHQDHHSGNIISRLNRATTALYRFAGDQFIYIETIIKFLVSLGFLLWISLPVGLLNLFTCFLAITTVFLFDRKLIPLYDRQNEIDNHVGAVLFDYISNMTTILTLRLGELTRSNLFQRLLSIWPFYRKDIVINEIKWFSMGTLISLSQSIILIVYILHSLHTTHAVMIGVIVMIFRYQWDLSEVFYNFSAFYSDLVRMNTDVTGLQPILDDIQRLVPLTQTIEPPRTWQTIQIQHLVFHHAGNERHKKILDNVSFKIKRGEKIALIGRSGGGKSTLLNIIRGLYSPEHVSLMIDNASFTSLDPLHVITTLIPQDPEIFENTIGFNISLDVPVAEQEIQQSIQLAGFSQVLATFPAGLATDIREKGLNLSVGQKQRLALARGLFAARFSSLILMDEPTSSVDLPTEREILSSVIQAYPDAAMMISLHRLHLLPEFDSVMLLDHGKVIASGPTAELLTVPGPVRDLWAAYQDK